MFETAYQAADFLHKYGNVGRDAADLLRTAPTKEQLIAAICGARQNVARAACLVAEHHGMVLSIRNTDDPVDPGNRMSFDEMTGILRHAIHQTDISQGTRYFALKNMLATQQVIQEQQTKLLEEYKTQLRDADQRLVGLGAKLRSLEAENIQLKQATPAAAAAEEEGKPGRWFNEWKTLSQAYLRLLEETMAAKAAAGLAESQQPAETPDQGRWGEELRLWQAYASYCRSCALSGEANPEDMETFALRRKVRQNVREAAQEHAQYVKTAAAVAEKLKAAAGAEAFSGWVSSGKQPSETASSPLAYRDWLVSLGGTVTSVDQISIPGPHDLYAVMYRSHDWFASLWLGSTLLCYEATQADVLMLQKLLQASRCYSAKDAADVQIRMRTGRVAQPAPKAAPATSETVVVPPVTITWRGSVTDLATDVAAVLTDEQAATRFLSRLEQQLRQKHGVQPAYGSMQQQLLNEITKSSNDNDILVDLAWLQAQGGRRSTAFGLQYYLPECYGLYMVFGPSGLAHLWLWNVHITSTATRGLVRDLSRLVKGSKQYCDGEAVTKQQADATQPAGATITGEVAVKLREDLGKTSAQVDEAAVILPATPPEPVEQS